MEARPQRTGAVPNPPQNSLCLVHTSPGVRGQDIKDLLPDRVARQRFGASPEPGGGNAPEPELCTSTADSWTDPRVSHRVHEPWVGETWFFEKGCTSRVPPYPIELMTVGPDAEEAGELANDAASILMKILYGARMGRWGLLKAVTSLAAHLTKWSKACDRALFRLMCYINSTTASTLTGYIGDPPADLRLRLYADADFAGDKESSRPTSGAFLEPRQRSKAACPIPRRKPRSCP